MIKFPPREQAQNLSPYRKIVMGRDNSPNLFQFQEYTPIPAVSLDETLSVIRSLADSLHFCMLPLQGSTLYSFLQLK